MLPSCVFAGDDPDAISSSGSEEEEEDTPSEVSTHDEGIPYTVTIIEFCLFIHIYLSLMELLKWSYNSASDLHSIEFLF